MGPIISLGVVQEDEIHVLGGFNGVSFALAGLFWYNALNGSELGVKSVSAIQSARECIHATEVARIHGRSLDRVCSEGVNHERSEL